MGSLIFGTTRVEGRNFDNIKVQTSKAGVPRPIIYGRARPVVGNIIAAMEPRIEIKREKQSGGKGGPSVVVENEEIYRTYAIRICEGPVSGITRVWRNNELVYDRDAVAAKSIKSNEFKEATLKVIRGNNDQFIHRASFFLGGFDQMPSAVMQAAFGTNNVHAYRGTCYMVVDDENLTENGGAVPQYSFEVERCEGFALTSRPYAVEVVDSLDIAPAVSDINLRPTLIAEPLDIRPAVTGITLNKVVQYSTHTVTPESMDIQPAVTGITLTQLVQYSTHTTAPESMDIQPAVTGITLTKVAGYLTHEIAPESMDIQPAVTGITLTKV